MKIIKETDSRYELLPQLWDKWNWNNIVIRNGSATRIVVPHELVINPRYIGRVILSDKADSYTSAIGLSMNSKTILGLTVQEYFDLMVLHINNTEDRPKCSFCNSELRFISMRYGYDLGSRLWNPNTTHFCSNSCQNQYRLLHPEIYGITGFRDPRTNALTHRSWFLNQGNQSDLCTLYSCILNNKFKFGITQELSQREHRYKTHEHQSSEFKLEPLVTKTRLEIANLEFYIKENFDYSESIELDQIDKFNNILSNLLKTDLTQFR